MKSSYTPPSPSSTALESLRLLPEEFEADDYQLRQIGRGGNMVLLEKSKPTHRLPSYEVIRVWRYPAECIRGRHYPAREAMPPSEAWGTDGWTFTDLGQAIRKFERLVEAPRNSSNLPVVTLSDAFCSGESIKGAD